VFVVRTLRGLEAFASAILLLGGMLDPVQTPPGVRGPRFGRTWFIGDTSAVSGRYSCHRQHRYVDDLRVGALVRAIRHRLGWTQRQLGRRAGVSQGLVSLMERGHLDRLTVRSVRRIAAVLEVQLPFAPRWRGGDAVRLLDAGHSAIVEHLVRSLRRSGWETGVEYTFNHFGERGSVDVLAWHPRHRALLISEVKTRLLDVQATLAVLDRKARVVPALVRGERGWNPIHLGIVIVMPGITANRSAVSRHAATFASSHPTRSLVVRKWIRHPAGPMKGLWFVSESNLVRGAGVRTARKRVREPKQAPAPAGHE
jgi:transcriptional regulator with XRE-family HTH domain